MDVSIIIAAYYLYIGREVWGGGGAGSVNSKISHGEGGSIVVCALLC